MKLTDFRQESSFNKLRKVMNAPLIEWDGSVQWNSFDPLGFRAALNEKGEVDIPFSEINIGSDDTLELFGQKILVYIRDQRGGYNSQYKFHIANCSTLRDAQTNNRYDRYVASVNTTGIFKVNIIHGNSWADENQDVEMKVCKNCLNKLNYKNYRKSINQRNVIYNDFDLNEFFDHYKRQNILKPKYSDITAPLNNYTRDFKEVADKIKEDENYICRHCNIDLTRTRQYLHAHHLNGIKTDNSKSNLIPLCIYCHSKQANHSHMKNHPDYRKFQTLKASL